MEEEPLSAQAMALLQQIVTSDTGHEKIEIEATAAKELLDAGCLHIDHDERGGAAVGAPNRWVSVTDHGRDRLKNG